MDSLKSLAVQEDMAQDIVFQDESVSAVVNAEIKSNVEDVECLR